MKISRRGMTSWLSKYRGPEPQLLSHASSALSLSKVPQSKHRTGWECEKREKKKKKKELMVQSCFFGRAPSGAHAEPAGPVRRRWPSHEGWWQPQRGTRAWPHFPLAQQPLPFPGQQGRHRGTKLGGAEDVMFWLPASRFPFRRRCCRFGARIARHQNASEPGQSEVCCSFF